MGKHKKKSTIHIGDGATQERKAQQGGITIESIAHENGRGNTTRQRANVECKIDKYWLEKRITDAERLAALRFREAYLRVNYGYNIRLINSPFLTAGTRPDPEARLMAHIDCIQFLKDACQVLSLPQQKVLRDVCAYDQYAGDKYKLKTLGIALEKLAIHWGYNSQRCIKEFRK